MSPKLYLIILQSLELIRVSFNSNTTAKALAAGLPNTHRVILINELEFAVSLTLCSFLAASAPSR